LSESQFGELTTPQHYSSLCTEEASSVLGWHISFVFLHTFRVSRATLLAFFYPPIHSSQLLGSGSFSMIPSRRNLRTL